MKKNTGKKARNYKLEKELQVGERLAATTDRRIPAEAAAAASGAAAAGCWYCRPLQATAVTGAAAMASLDACSPSSSFY
ncbi:hypothetical protein PIB30_114658, partial [Stylosanthes scabra]|nr:hypothetical protein [Stylosanthes scabra]